MKTVINIALYQFAWFLCVFYGFVGALATLPFLLLHFYYSACKKADLKLVFLLLILGFTIDGILQMSGVLTFATPAWPIPFWLATIWMFLAILPNHSLQWMKKQLLLSAIFGALGGPLAYWAGVQAGVAGFGRGVTTSLLILAGIWAVLWPFVMYIAARDVPYRQ